MQKLCKCYAKAILTCLHKKKSHLLTQISKQKGEETPVSISNCFLKLLFCVLISFRRALAQCSRTLGQPMRTQWSLSLALLEFSKKPSKAKKISLPEKKVKYRSVSELCSRLKKTIWLADIPKYLRPMGSQ